jgi:hypothetical protein
MHLIPKMKVVLQPRRQLTVMHLIPKMKVVLRPRRQLTVMHPIPNLAHFAPQCRRKSCSPLSR